jgi:hypothetical protein
MGYKVTATLEIQPYTETMRERAIEAIGEGGNNNNLYLLLLLLLGASLAFSKG